MNQKEYTFSNKDKKFLAVLMFLHLSFTMMIVSFYGLYYKEQTSECKRLSKKLDMADWAQGELDKANTEQKLESIKQKYKNQGIEATEY